MEEYQEMGVGEKSDEGEAGRPRSFIAERFGHFFLHFGLRSTAHGPWKIKDMTTASKEIPSEEEDKQNRHTDLMQPLHS